MSKESKWYFEHDEIDCPECRDGADSYPLNLYLGTHKGEDAQKYVCTNPDCGYVEIKLLKDLTEEMEREES